MASKFNSREVFRSGFDSITNKILPVRSIFSTFKKVNKILYDKQSLEQLNKVIIDHLMYQMYFYSYLQFTIRLDEILKNLTDFTRQLESQSSDLFKQDVFKDNPHKIKAWTALFGKKTKCPVCEKPLKKEQLLNSKRSPSNVSWNILRQRISRLHKPIKDVRDKMAAHSDKNINFHVPGFKPSPLGGIRFSI